MDREARRAAASAWKERPANAGVYSFGPAGGPLWIGASKTLDAVENRLRFTLRTGGMAAPDLTAAWAEARGEGFRFEVLERLDPKLSPMAQARELKDRLKLWTERLAARPISPQN